MKSKQRVERTRLDLERELREQMQMLQHDCESYDSGLEIVGKRIAVALRILLHDTRNSRSLLEQMGLRAGRFASSAEPLDPKNLLTESNLTLLRMKMTIEGGERKSEWRHFPKTARTIDQVRFVPFAEWWGEPVLKDEKRRTFCRREIVLNVADTDGGAHVDPGLEEAYMDLSRNNSVGFEYASNGNPMSPFEGRIELACIRQIAHETILTLRKVHPSAFDTGLTAR